MDENRKRGSDNKKPIQPNKKKPNLPNKRHENINPNQKIPDSKKKMEPETKTQHTIKINLRPRTNLILRRKYVHPRKKRQEYIDRLENLFEQLDNIQQNENIPTKTKLRAMDTLNRTIKTCYVMITDIEIEELEEEFNRIKNSPEPDVKNLYEIEQDPDEKVKTE